MQRTLVIALGVLVVVGGITAFFFTGSSPSDQVPSGNGTEVSERFAAEQVSGEFEYIKEPRMIGGKLAFIATNDDSNRGEQFVVHGGEKVGKSFYQVIDLEAVGGEPVYIGMEYQVQGENNRRLSLYRGDELVDERNVMGMSVLDGELAYAVTEEQQEINQDASLSRVGRSVETSIVYNGEEYSPDEGNIVDYGLIDGEFVYTVIQGNETYVVQGGEQHRSFQDISEMQDIGGQLVYVGWTEDGAQIVIDGRLGPSYDRVRGVTSFDGEVAYIAGQGRPEFVVVGGEERQRFDNVADLSVVGGALTYTAQDDDGNWRYMHGGEGYGAYEAVGSATVIDGSFAFIASEFGQSFVVHQNQSMQRFPGIDYLGEFQGEPAYIAERGDGQRAYIVGDNIHSIYQDVPYFIQTEKGPVFAAEKQSGEVVVVGRDVSGTYDIISPGEVRPDGSVMFAAKRDDNIYVVRHE